MVWVWFTIGYINHMTKERRYSMGHGDIAQDKVRISLVIPKDLKEELERQAQSQDRSMSNYIVMLLKTAVSQAQGK